MVMSASVYSWISDKKSRFSSVAYIREKTVDSDCVSNGSICPCVYKLNLKNSCNYFQIRISLFDSNFEFFTQ